MNCTNQKENNSPIINSPKIFGVRNGSPFLFKIAATGEAPLSYKASRLPEGLYLDENTGIINGEILGISKEYRIKLSVTNRIGHVDQDFIIIQGDDICLTPPMGWNSWYCYSELVSEKSVRETAIAIVEKGLINHGWTYINIDDCWQGERDEKSGAIQPNERFEDMKRLCDFIHSLGLKIGIYSTPWMGSYSGFIGGSESMEKGDISKSFLPPDERLQKSQVFGRYPGSLDKKVDRVGERWLFDLDVKQWAEWGIDYVKVDWSPNDVPTTKRIYDNLRNCGRDIVLSLSNTTPFENVEALSMYANCWRTTGDINDDWTSLSKIAFEQEKWQPFTRRGHWNDPDMLQLGNLGTTNRMNETFNPTNLSADEQYTQMSMWCLLSAPLVLSCEIASLDDFSLKLLTNDEVIAVNQDPAGLPAEKILHRENLQIWSKALSDGGTAVGIFNSSDKPEKICLKSEITLDDGDTLRNLWSGKNINTLNRDNVVLNTHGALLLKKVRYDTGLVQ